MIAVVIADRGRFSWPIIAQSKRFTHAKRKSVSGKPQGGAAKSSSPAIARDRDPQPAAVPAKVELPSALTANLLLKWSDVQTIKPIGSGAFGDVHEASWQSIPVAVKTLHLRSMPENIHKEFVNEATIMANCHHPNIVRMYGYCEEAGRIGLVMELMPRGSLYDILHSSTSLSWRQRVRIALDIALGLRYLHSKNILHRDLKSMNVLVDEHLRAKIADFGQSKVKSQTASTMTVKSAVGTRRWRAPELFKRDSVANPSTDVYSLGMVLWEIASRKIPFGDAESEDTAIDWIKSGEKERFPVDCPKDFVAIATQCWSTSPAQRPPVEAVVAALESLLKSLPIVDESSALSAADAAAPAPQQECAVCMDNTPDHALVPCGHIFCESCAKAAKNCPICRKQSTMAMRLYLS